MRKFLFAAYLILLSVPVFADSVQSQFSMHCESKDSPFCWFTNDVSEKITNCTQLTKVARPARGQVYLIDHNLLDTCTQAQRQRQIGILENDDTCDMTIHYPFTNFSDNFPTHMVAWCDKDTSVNITYEIDNLNCIPQDTYSSKTGVLENPDHKWLYCGGFSSDKDCGTGTYVLGIDNRLYRCQVDQTTKEGTWTALDISDIEWCRGSLTGVPGDSRPFNDASKTKQIMNTDKTHILGFLYRNKAIGSDAIESFCYEEVQTCAHNNETVGNTTYIYLNQNICDNIENMPVWGQTDESQILMVSQKASQESKSEYIHSDSNATQKEREEATQKETTPEPVVQPQPTAADIDAAQQKLTDAQQKLADAREKQNSLGNRLVNAGASAATGYGARMVATAMAEQSADAKAESDMREWIDTMKCEYGDGQVFNVGTETIYLPGGDEISEYAKEYKNMAGELKKTKAALGLKPGIESETIYDRADYDLYSYNPAERQSSDNVSVSRALMYSTSEDAIAWAEQKQESEQNKKIGTGVAIGGTAVGVIGNTAINTDAIQKIKNAFKKD